MNLHEYQGKHLFREYGLAVSKGEIATNAAEALKVADNLGGNRWIVKAQVHAGGRGKAGGVRLVSSREELTQAVNDLIGTRLVTYQTDENGQPVNQVLIEEPCHIDRELYLSAVIDRATRRVVIMASTEGGVEIEEVAHKTPEKILKIIVDPLLGVLPYQCRELAFALELKDDQVKQFEKILTGLYQLFTERDLSLVEINPLVVTKEANLLCLDAKVNVDDNAMYRRPIIREMRDITQEEEREVLAQKWQLNYIKLEGDIGCMVNGAGLAMATMDLIKLNGGNPANFLDVGGGATKERVTEAFKIILSDMNVKAVFVNIFGGIVRCDLIAEGIMGAVAEVSIEVPVVVRLQGNRADVGAQLLEESCLNIIAKNDFTEAAQAVVRVAREESA